MSPAKRRKKFVRDYEETYGFPPDGDIEKRMAAWGTDAAVETPREKHARLAKAEKDNGMPENSLQPDYNKSCGCCGSSPVVPQTGMCGPCTFGDATTVGGGW